MGKNKNKKYNKIKYKLMMVYKQKMLKIVYKKIRIKYKKTHQVKKKV